MYAIQAMLVLTQNRFYKFKIVTYKTVTKKIKKYTKREGIVESKKVHNQKIKQRKSWYKRSEKQKRYMPYT